MPGTVESVYDTVLRVIMEGRYKKVEPSEFTKMITFRTGASLMTWGQRWIVQVSVGVDGLPHVIATVTPRNGGQQLDAARIAKLANEFYQKVAAAAQPV
ncbi:hypothetical protein [Pseudarthrobacter sp. LT1]|uniref:hypothetical protein n=1 Tax=Pseudarthrobacter sp. LT1 TaxID=3111450 RepID=UPI002D7A0BD0|nr:hypothetical protein [Pseudarthrobacter sp. LT1]WRT14638.1 hypothetical protein VIK36_03860 [Pseudarthrobacter sp. LT1]